MNRYEFLKEAFFSYQFNIDSSEMKELIELEKQEIKAGRVKPIWS